MKKNSNKARQVMETDYSSWILKEYLYWTLYLHEEKQLPYLGRCYAWWNDSSSIKGEKLSFGALPVEALVELQKISQDVTIACEALGYETVPYGKAFLLNTCYLANEEAHGHHMHVHFIPRSGVFFYAPCINKQIEDYEWGRNYSSARQHRFRDNTSFEVVKRTMAGAIRTK